MGAWHIEAKREKRGSARLGVLAVQPGALLRSRYGRVLAGPGSCPCAVDGNRARMRGLADVAACRCGSGAGVLGKPHKQLLFPICVHPVQAPIHACPHPARACIVLPRAAPRSAAARTPRTGYCGRRRRSDRPFRTGFIRWLVEGHVLSQAPVFHEFLESIFFNFKVLIWTESSILAQDERWRRA